MSKPVHLLAPIVGIAAVLVALGLLLDAPGRGRCRQCWFNPSNPHYRGETESAQRSGGTFNLKALITAEVDFRVNDRDGNGVQDFHRKDVAGLYGMAGADGQPIALIEISAARADDRPLHDLSTTGPLKPLRGYWYRAIRHAGEERPDPNRFTFCSFPEDYPRHGRRTFIVDENCKVWWKDLARPGGVETFPADPAKEGWTKID